MKLRIKEFLRIFLIGDEWGGDKDGNRHIYTDEYIFRVHLIAQGIAIGLLGFALVLHILGD